MQGIPCWCLLVRTRRRHLEFLLSHTCFHGPPLLGGSADPRLVSQAPRLRCLSSRRSHVKPIVNLSYPLKPTPSPSFPPPPPRMQPCLAYTAVQRSRVLPLSPSAAASSNQTAARLFSLWCLCGRSLPSRPIQLSVLTRVSQMHEALSSIVDACQSPGDGSKSSSSSPADSQRAGARQHRHQNGGGGGEGGGGDADGYGGIGEGTGWASAGAVTAEEGAIIVERSRSCLKVSLVGLED